MVKNSPPLNQNSPIVDKSGRPTTDFLLLINQLLKSNITAAGDTAQDALDLATAANALATTALSEADALQLVDIIAGVGLAGGGLLGDGDVTIDLEDTAVTPATYGDATHVPQLTVDQQGRITNVVPVAISGGGGGGGASERTRVKPVAADFTIQNDGSGGTAVTLSDTTYGLHLYSPAASSPIRFIKSNAAAPATPYTVILRSQQINAVNNNYSFKRCLIMRNSSSGKLLIFGVYNLSILLQIWNNYGSYQTDLAGPINVSELMPWYSVYNDGTTLEFRVSPDGIAWFTIATTALSSFLISIDEIGFGHRLDGIILSDIFQSFEVV